MEENRETGLDPAAIALILGGIAIVLGAIIYFQKAGEPTTANNIAATGQPDLGLNNVAQTPLPGGQQQAQQQMQQTDKLLIQDDTVGSGAEATSGATVTVNYTGMLTDGKVFDSSIPRNQPFSFQLGAGQVIQGWEQGVAGMKVGGKRRLVIPPNLGYGPQGTGPIPGNATLIFDIELLKVE